MAGFSVITELTSQSVNKELSFYLELQKNYKNKKTYKKTNRTPKKEHQKKRTYISVKSTHGTRVVHKINLFM